MKEFPWRGFILGVLVTALSMGFINTATASVGRQSAEVDYNDIQVTLNNRPVNLVDANGSPVEPFAISGTTYLPVRAIASALGLEVGWDQDTKTVILAEPEAKRPVYITQTGKRYHYESTCNGGTYWEVPFSTALGLGLTPCDKCVLH